MYKYKVFVFIRHPTLFGFVGLSVDNSLDFPAGLCYCWVKSVDTSKKGIN